MRIGSMKQKTVALLGALLWIALPAPGRPQAEVVTLIPEEASERVAWLGRWTETLGAYPAFEE